MSKPVTYCKLDRVVNRRGYRVGDDGSVWSKVYIHTFTGRGRGAKEGRVGKVWKRLTPVVCSKKRKVKYLVVRIDSFQKTTCLWLIGLPKLIPTKIVSKGEFVTFASGKRMSKWYYESLRDKKNGQTNRSRTFPGIAEAMADQWTTYDRPRGFNIIVPRKIKEDWEP